MGNLAYGQTLNVEFEDRTLAHLQIVIGSKLRRNEAFYFSWKDDQRVGDGRTTIWVHPTIPLVFKFFGGRPPAINREWLHLLEQGANTPAGLHLMNEPSPAALGQGEK